MSSGGGERAAIRAVAVTFAVNGVTAPSLLPRFPQIATQVGAGEAAFGIALAGIGVGGLVGGVLAPLVARRLGLVRATRAWGLALCGTVVVVGVVPSVAWLAVALGVVGLVDAAHDISMNEIAVGEQSRRPASVMGRLHGLWSVGATVGTAIGAGAAALGVPVVVHIGVVALLAAVAQLRVARSLRARPGAAVGAHDGVAGGQSAGRSSIGEGPSIGPADAQPGDGRGRVARLGLLGVLALVTLMAMLAEGTPLDWAALTLRRGLGASPGVAGAGPLVFSAGVLLGRTVTDPLVDRFGAARVVLSGNLLAALAMAAGVVTAGSTGEPWPVLAGLVVAGVGVAGNFPLLFGAGDRVATLLRLPAGTGTSVVGTLPRIGGLVLPVVVGLVADRAGLLVALGLTTVGAVAVAALLPRLLDR